MKKWNEGLSYMEIDALNHPPTQALPPKRRNLTLLI